MIAYLFLWWLFKSDDVAPSGGGNQKPERDLRGTDVGQDHLSFFTLNTAKTAFLFSAALPVQFLTF